MNSKEAFDKAVNGSIRERYDMDDFRAISCSRCDDCFNPQRLRIAQDLILCTDCLDKIYED